VLDSRVLAASSGNEEAIYRDRSLTRFRYINQGMALIKICTSTLVCLSSLMNTQSKQATGMPALRGILTSRSIQMAFGEAFQQVAHICNHKPADTDARIA
jgi:hypothetical protein